MIDWDLRAGKPAHKFDAGHVNSILLHGPNQEQIISSSDGTDGARLVTLLQSLTNLLNVACPHITDHTVRLWSRAQGTCIQTLADDSVVIHAMQKKHFATQPTAILTGWATTSLGHSASAILTRADGTPHARNDR